MFLWKTDRFTQFGSAIKSMKSSNATLGWVPLKEIGTQNIYLPVAGYYGSTKTTGKTRMLRHLAEGTGRHYVSLDDLATRDL